jgi:hypothetical protein
VRASLEYAAVRVLLLRKQRAFASTGAAILIALAGLLLVATFWTSKTNALGTGTRRAVYATGSFSFATPQQLLPNTPLPLGFQDVEPEVKVDLFGNIYVSAIEGVPAGVDLWKSTDKGATFHYLGQPDGAQCPVGSMCTNDAGLGGGDDSIDVSTGGYLYVSSLWLGSVTMSASYDGGTGGAAPGQKWEVNPVAAAVPSDDRQWVAAYGPQTVYMSYRQILAAGANTSNVIFVAKSTDGGKTFPQQVATFPATSTVTARREGNLVVDPYTGTLYTSFRPQELNGHTRAELWLLKSTDGGATWMMSLAYQGPTGTDIGNVFPVMAVDRGGNVHVAFSQCNYDSATGNSSNCKVYLMSSTNQGQTWLPAVQVNSGADTSYAILPWMTAGSPGVVDLTWYGSNITNSTQAADWHLYFAQTTNATSATPTFTQMQAIPQVVHNKDICLKGGACGSTGNRALAEYYQIALDPEGNANIAFTDTVNSNTSGDGRTWFTQQTAGPSAYAPPAPPAASTFAANVPMPGTSPGTLGGGAEPGIKVDSHNCIYTTAPGNPFVWKSSDNGLTFTPPVNPVADEPTLTGGDEEILPFPPNPTGKDPVYFGDLGLSSVHVRKSIDGGETWFKPGPGGAAGDVAISSDRQWYSGDRAPAASDFTIYEMDHELSTEDIRFHALTNDTAWSADASGITSSELILPPDSTFPNTNPGPVMVDKNTHQVFGFFNASTLRNNAVQPPFGKMPNIWEAMGPGTLAAGAPPGPFTNLAVFRGVFDSPTTAPPPGTVTFGTNCSNDFPAAAIDNAGNLYVVWSMNNARNNRYSIWFAASHDHGQTFYGPFEVSQGIGAAVMPWIAAGDDGRVDIVYYGTSAAVDPNTVAMGDKNVAWNVFFAQSLNANTREPVFAVTQASDHVNHYGVICNLGLLCASGTRTLADFFQVAIGPDGIANIVYADDAASSTHPVYARQNSGPLALTNPVAAQCVGGASPTPTATATASPTATATATASPTATATATPTASASPTPEEVQMLNISGRARVDTGDNVSIAGFIISGERAKRVIVRGIGPSMKSGGAPVPGRLMDPFIELHDNAGRLIQSNDNWRSDQQQEIQATGLAPGDDHEAAIVLTLAPDTYTVVLRGTNNTSGIGLIEVYDLSPTTESELGNLSVRANVLTNDNVLIDGLILRGGLPKRVLFRAIGPELNGVVPNPLQDPVMELHGENGALLMSNDNWRDASNANDIQATGMAPKDDRESAILVTLPPANYTTIVRGKNNTTGIALNEAFKLQ